MSHTFKSDTLDHSFLFNVSFPGHARNYVCSDLSATDSADSNTQNMLAAPFSYRSYYMNQWPEVSATAIGYLPTLCSSYGSSKKVSSPRHKLVVEPVCSCFLFAGSKKFTCMSIFS
jgi:hypothetical protein